jgi:hypothetical protein
LRTGVSDNVGGVKRFLSTLSHALGEERHFALLEEEAALRRMVERLAVKKNQ